MSERISIAGTGNVGSALASLLFRAGRTPEILLPGWESDPPREGLLFLTVPDCVVEELLAGPLRDIPAGLRVIHFAAGLTVVRERLWLLHPFAAIRPESDLTQLLFLLAGKKDEELQAFFKMVSISFFSSPAVSGVGYHTAAVLAGNFTQYLYLAARELLVAEGFACGDIDRLLRQLIESSLDAISRENIQGVTGPAARGDNGTIEREARFLETRSPDVAALYQTMTELIKKAKKNGNILD